MNPFVFSNVFICLNILGNEWSPSLKISQITLRILSMLSQTRIKRKTSNDDKICARGLKSPKEATWIHRYKDLKSDSKTNS